MSYLFSDSEDVHAAAQFGEDARRAMNAEFLPQRRRRILPRRPKRILGNRPAALLSGLGADPTDPREFFLKYEEKTLRYAKEIETVRSDGAKQTLRKALAPITAEYGRIKPAFAPGAAAGQMDLSRMKDWSDHVNSFSRDLTAAKKQYGTATPAPAPAADVFVGPRQPVAPPEPESSPLLPLLLVGGGLLAAIALGR